MNFSIVITKTLKTDNNKTFKVGEEIAFSMKNEEDDYLDRYIGKIEEIEDNYIVISKVEINRCKIDGTLKVYLDKIFSNSCNYVCD